MFKLSHSFEMPRGASEIMVGTLAECLNRIIDSTGPLIHIERDADQTFEAYDVAAKDGRGIALFTIVEHRP